MIKVASHNRPSKVSEVLFNPFPGLRPFGTQESHLFFGREGQSDEVVELLAKNNFAAVIGASGSGKSSLMQCGILPVLFGGFIDGINSSWHNVISRPGSNPIDNLSDALVESVNGADKITLKKQITSTVLRGSSLGLIEAIKQIRRPKNENVLIVIDQFEELFRFQRESKIPNAENEALAFIKLLVNAVNQNELPIYVMLTMRSDFIGDCAQYPELTGMINKSHYLVPQMTRDNLRDAIVGPVAVGGGAISTRLVEELLNGVGDNPDQLPILQHALMRTWGHWVDEGAVGDLDLKHYDAIGGMEQALSMHANEAFDELSQDQKKLCERIFKTLTEKGLDNRGIRHPSTVREVSEVSGGSIKEITNVVDKFRIEGRSFISPGIDKEITASTILDISHESLMRVWQRLTNWVDDEAGSIQMYTRLAEAAGQYQVGKVGLWRPPDLQLALAWREKQQPNLSWAQRYDPAFERGLVFLETSEKEYREEEENKLRVQKRTLRRTKVFAIILALFTVLSFGLMLWAFTQKQEADKQTLLAEQAKAEALSEKETAEQARTEALLQKEQAELSKAEAILQKEQADKSRQNAERQTQIAEKAKRNAMLAEDKATREAARAKEALARAEKAREAAKKAQFEAENQKNIAENAEKDALNLRMLSIANAMAIKSQQIRRDTIKRGLIAYQAYEFNKKHGGKTYNPDVYSGMYYALKLINDEEYNSLEGHTEAVRAMQYGPKDGKLYSAGSDGKLLKWTNNEPEEIFSTDDLIRSIKIKKDNTKIALATSSSSVHIIDLTDSKPKSIDLKDAHQGIIWDLEFSDNNLYSLGRDGYIHIWSLENNEIVRTIDLGDKIRAIDVEADKIAVATLSGKISLLDLNGGNEEILVLDDEAYYAVELSPDGKTLIAGDKNGEVKVWDLETNTLLTSLEGHNARINDLKFNADGSMFAAASNDKLVQIWHTDSLNDEPLALNDHEWWVFSVAFSPDNLKVVSGCSDNLIRQWPLDTEDMAKDIAVEVKRNMTRKEWDRYVADDIPYEKTIENLPSGDEVEDK